MVMRKQETTNEVHCLPQQYKIQSALENRHFKTYLKRISHITLQMQNLYCLVTLLLVISMSSATSPPDPNPCPSPFYVSSPIGCIKACTHPDYKKCPDIFIRIYNPTHCAYTNSGEWLNYTFDCQACSSGTVVGVDINNTCSCKHLGCPYGQTCKNEQCVPTPINPPNLTCTNVYCLPGYYCKNGECLKTNPQCPAPSFIEISSWCYKTCDHSDFSNCPKVYSSTFTSIQISNFCILTVNGWREYTSACQACSLPNIKATAIDNQPCSCKHTGCPLTQKCQNKKCVPSVIVPINPCSIVLCPPGQYCQNGMCKLYNPPSICQSGYIFTPVGCIKSCRHPDFLNCPNFFPLIYNPSFCGYRPDGTWLNYTFECQACANKQMVAVDDEPCSCKHTGCSPGYVCKDKTCISNYPSIIVSCQLIVCPFGFYCEKGQCREIPPIITCATIFCSPGFTCVNNRCVPQITCANILCQIGYTCIDAECIKIPQLTCASILCVYGFICDQKTLHCVPKMPEPPTIITCSNIICSPGYTCDRQKLTCVLINPPIIPPIITCDSILCFPGYVCRNSRCERQITVPINPCAAVLCLSGYTCVDGKCILRDPCLDVTCSPTTFCSNGRCISVTPPNLGICNGIRCQIDEYCNQNQICYPKNPQCKEGPAVTALPCLNPRPNQNTCPTIFFFAPPANVACGRTNSGEYRNYPVRCYACKDIQVTSFWSIPCNQLPFCPNGQTCSNGRCISKPDPCPKTCKYGCNYYGGCYECQRNDHCSQNEICIQRKCVDKCALVRCSAGYQCVKGECIKKYQCKDKEDCEHDWETCFQGKCIDKCDLLRCAGCKYGICGPPIEDETCKNNNDCKQNWQICINYKCIDRCQILKCAGCKKGICGQTNSGKY